MKRLLLVLISSILFCTGIWGQCPPGNVTLEWQSQVDNFPITYPNCNTISGTLTIGKGASSPSSSNITTLEPLSQITTIEQSLNISSNDNLVDLTGLDNISSIEKGLGINNNDNLVNLASLSNITSLGSGMSIFENANLTTLTGLNNITSVEGDIRISNHPNLTTLQDLSNITSMDGTLYIRDNDELSDLTGLHNITSFGDNLVEVQIGTNSNLISIAALSNITEISERLWISGNNNLVDLTGLDNLTSVGGDLLIQGNDSLTNLVGLDNLTSINGRMSISGNDNLINLTGLGNLISIDDRMSISNNDNLINLEGLDNLESVYAFSIFRNDNLVTLNGMENLNFISEPFNVHNITISIYDNASLVSLIGMENVYIGGIVVMDLLIYNNPQLSICNLPNICAYVENDESYMMYDNAFGCNNDIEILGNCYYDISGIQTFVFYDFNENKIQDAEEPNYYNASISIQPTSNFYYTQNDGIFYIESGTYTATFDQITNPDWQLTTDSISYFLSLEENEIDTITFGIYPIQQISNLLPVIISPPNRCNETITFDVSTKNLGTTIADGILWLEVDENILATNFIDTPDTIVVPNRYGWFFSDLFPSQSIEKQIALQIPGPPDFPVGDLLEFNSYADFEDENGTNISPTFTYPPEVRCSYDPNDKLVNPTREGDYALFDEDLIYTVRFQNTGNDVAFDVVIRDTLDANLDRESFRLLGSSHAEQLNTNMSADGILTFEFRDIFLPDSTSNFEGSQGYVSYLIRTIDGLAEETPVTNSAGIFFDLNPPVITNTVQSVMVSELPIVSILSPENELDFSIIPNPNTGIFYIQGITNGRYRIFNTVGQIIRSGRINSDATIDIPQAASGIYFIEIQENGQVGTQRFVKQ